MTDEKQADRGEAGDSLEERVEDLERNVADLLDELDDFHRKVTEQLDSFEREIAEIEQRTEGGPE